MLLMEAVDPAAPEVAEPKPVTPFKKRVAARHQDPTRAKRMLQRSSAEEMKLSKDLQLSTMSSYQLKNKRTSLHSSKT